MNILHIANFKNYGGVPKLVSNLVHHQLYEQKIDTAIFSPLIKTKEIAINGNIIKIIGGEFKNGYDLSIKKIIRTYKLFCNYDILHFHGFNPLLAYLAVKSQKKIVHTEHGTFQKDNLALSISKFINKKILGMHFLENYVDVVVCNSAWMKNDLSLTKADCRVITNAVANYEIPKTPRTENNFTILFVGRLVQKKKVERLINSLAISKNKNYMTLKIIGDGPLIEELKERAKSLLPNGSFRFIGYSDNVAYHYSNSDLFIFSSRNEPFGLTFVEAMFASLPVLCFKDAGGCYEILSSINPWLCADDEIKMAEKIDYLFENAEERKNIGAELYKKAVNEFSLNIMAKKYYELYQEILERC